MWITMAIAIIVIIKVIIWSRERRHRLDESRCLTARNRTWWMSLSETSACVCVSVCVCVCVCVCECLVPAEISNHQLEMNLFLSLLFFFPEILLQLTFFFFFFFFSSSSSSSSSSSFASFYPILLLLPCAASMSNEGIRLLPFPFSRITKTGSLSCFCI